MPPDLEARYQALFETTLDGIMIVDDAGTYVDVNESLCRLLKTPREQLIGASFGQFIPPELLERATSHFGDLKREGAFAGEFPLRAADGSIIELEWGSRGNFLPGLHFCVARDITHRKAAERELQLKQQELEDFVENATVGLHWVGPDGTILWANRAELELLGYAREEYVGHNIAEFHVDAPVIADILERLSRKEELHSYEARLRCKDGSVRYVLISSNVRWDGDRFVHTRCFTRDITPRRLAEEETERQRQWLRTTLSSIGDAVIATDAHGAITFMNAVAEQLTGWTEAEAQSQPLLAVFRIINEHTRLPATDPVRDVLEHDHGVGLANHTLLIARDGREYVIDDSAAPIRDPAGAVIGVVIIFRDITERRRLEIDARRLAAIVDSSDDAIVGKDLNGIVHSWNKAAERIFGYPAEEMVGQPIARLIPPERPDEEPEILRRLARGERIDHFETVRVRKDGTRIDISVTISPIRNDEGRIVGASKVARDITERKRAEEAIRENEAMLTAVVAGLPVGVGVTDTQGRTLLLNPAGLELHGFTSLAEMYHRFEQYQDEFELSYPDGGRMPIEEWPLSRALAAEYVNDYEVVLKRGPHAEERVVCYSVVPVEDRAGKPCRFVFVMQDITGRKQVERTLRQEAVTVRTINQIGQSLLSELGQEKLVQSLTDAATELVGAEFGAFFYNVVNEQGEKYALYALSGVPREAFAVFPMPRNTDLFGPTFRGEGVVRSDDIVRDPRYGRNPPYYGMPEGHLPVHSYLAVPVVSRAGEVLGGLFFGHESVGVFTEAHEQLLQGVAAQAAIALENASLYREAEQARVEAEVASRMKDEFLATVSHELRTPLNAILGYAQLLRQPACKPEQMAKGLETIERNVRVQAQLINDLLDVSRIISGKLRLDVQPVDLAAVIHAAVDAVVPAADAKGIRIERILDPLAARVSGDPSRLQQVIWNLLANAIKFTPNGGRVQVLLERVNSHLEVTVADTGQGIAPDFLPHVFERFRQVDSTTTRRHGGLGLGLAIVRHLVELHGGTVRAKSPGEGQGATFVVTLPLPILQDPADLSRRVHPLAEPPHRPSGLEAPLECPPSLKDLRVLVVDDEPDARELMKLILEECEVIVEIVPSAPAALAVIAEFQPEVLISDIGMPEMDGYELIRAVRALPPERGGRVAAAALTAYARPEDRRRALLAGFQAHLPKPIERDDLLTIVASLAGRTG